MKPTPYFNAFLGALLSLVVACVLFLLSTLAHAQGVTPDSACGEYATGARKSDGALFTGARAGQRVGPDGYWRTCEPPPPKVALPKACPPAAGQSFRTWAVNGQLCTTYSRYASSATDPARDRQLRHGETGYWQQWQGSMRGQLIERCSDGARAVTGITCAPVTHCDSRWSFTADGGRTTFVFDARGSRKVPIGETVQATAADGRTMPIRCVAGNFARVR